MKFLVLLTVLFNSVISFSQTNCDCIENKYDKITDTYTLQSKQFLMIKNDSTKDEFKIFMFKRDKNSIIILIIVEGGKSCIDKFSKINVLFADQTRMELYNIKNFNCESVVEIGLGFSNVIGVVPDKYEVFNNFLHKKIETIRIWTGNTYVQNDFKPDDQIKFQTTLNCLVDDKLRKKLVNNDDVYY